MIKLDHPIKPVQTRAIRANPDNSRPPEKARQPGQSDPPRHPVGPKGVEWRNG